MNKLLATSVTAVLAITGTYSFATWRRLSSTDIKSITTYYTAPNHLKESSTAKSIVNPRTYVPIEDVRSTSVKVPHGLTDEIILARYVKGFFGGYVFTPESIILKALRLDFTSFIALKDIEIPLQIWSQSQVSDTKLPPLHSMLFGAFQVVDCNIANFPEDSPAKSHSYIDFVYGGDNRVLAGVHRFSVHRKDGWEDGTIEIEFSSLNINPSGNPPGPSMLRTFHQIYAMLLFREAVSNVVGGRG